MEKKFRIDYLEVYNNQLIANLDFGEYFNFICLYIFQKLIREHEL